MNRGTSWMIATALLAGALAMLTTAVAEAQFAPRGRPRFGYTNLRAGFTPDPHVVSGQMGGPVQANQINSSCRGNITPQPSHIVRSPSGFRQIRFVVAGDRDSTLMVMLPNGQVLCDDDGGDGMNPLIATSSPPGDIRVWVGAYSSSNVGQSYRMGITELSHVSANNLGGSGRPPPGRGPVAQGPLNPNLPPAFGAVNLRSGFMPDPHIVSGTAGGSISASSVQSGCRGHITPQPSHVLMSQTGFRSIRFVAHSGIDTTLVVMLPNGQIVCDDDGGDGLNPIVATNSPPGPIRVWVGSYSGNRTGPYNLGFSELGSVGTGNIPSPGGGGGGPVVVQPVNPPPSQAEVVQMDVGIPVTLMGPGMSANIVAMWNPRGGPPTQVTLSGRSLTAGGVTLASVPPTMSDPIITVTQQRNGTLVARAEQPGTGRGDPGQALLLQIRWAGRPTVANRWTGSAAQRGPRWSR